MYVLELLEQEIGVIARIESKSIQLGDVSDSFAEMDHSRKLPCYGSTTIIDVGNQKFLAWHKTLNSIQQ